MTYGHNDSHHGSADTGNVRRKAANDHGWRGLDESRRMALVEQALGHRHAAA